jgi:hypothetical protein
VHGHIEPGGAERRQCTEAVKAKAWRTATPYAYDRRRPSVRRYSPMNHA